MTIGDRLHALREEKGYTLDKVARIIGTTRQTMSRYETGIITKIKYDTIVALANVYRVHPGYLMGWCDRDGTTRKEQIELDRKKLIDFVENIPADELDLYIALSQYPREKLQAIVDLLK
jgi:transcriptional regulator with XRE-family HTH domain